MFVFKFIWYNLLGGRFCLGLRDGDDPQFIQAPTTPAPSSSETAADIYKSKLEYDPKMAELQMQMQQQYAPQQAELYQNLWSQYYPEMARQQQSLQQELSPYQSQLMEAGSQQALQRLQSPFAYTPGEEAALADIRGGQQEDLSKRIRERANLGGGLYGGRAAAREEEAGTELQQEFASQDINRRLQAGQQASQQALQFASGLPQLGGLQPQINPFQFQSATPSPDNLYNAMFQASQPQQMYQQGAPSPLWGLGGDILGGMAGGMFGLGGMMGQPIK